MPKRNSSILVVILLFSLGVWQPAGGETENEFRLKAAAQRTVGFPVKEFIIKFYKCGKMDEADVTVVPKPPSKEPKHKVVFIKDGDRWRVIEVYKIAEKVIKIDLYYKGDLYEIKGHRIRSVGKWHYLKDCNHVKGKIPYGVITDAKHKPLGFFQVRLKGVKCYDWIDPLTKKMTGGMEVLSEGRISWELPYIPDGKYAIVYDRSGKKLLTIDIQNFCIKN